MQKAEKVYPLAEHVNTVCNDKIRDLPADFRGKFLVEESYYETNGKKHASAHLFLFTEEQDGVLLTSYEIPEGEDKNSFTYASMKPVDYGDLKKSEKFTPALYREKDGVWGRRQYKSVYPGYEVPALGTFFRGMSGGI